MSQLLTELKFSGMNYDQIHEYIMNNYSFSLQRRKQSDFNDETIKLLKNQFNNEYEIMIPKLIKAFSISEHKNYYRFLNLLENTFSFFYLQNNETVWNSQSIKFLIDTMNNSIFDKVESNPTNHLTYGIIQQLDISEIFDILNQYLDDYNYSNPDDQIIKNSSSHLIQYGLLTKLVNYSYMHDVSIEKVLSRYEPQIYKKISVIINHDNFKKIIKKFKNKYEENYNYKHVLLSYYYKNEAKLYSFGIKMNSQSFKKELIDQSKENLVYLKEDMITKNKEIFNQSTGQYAFHDIYRQLSDFQKLKKHNLLTKEAYEAKKTDMIETINDLQSLLKSLKDDFDK